MELMNLQKEAVVANKILMALEDERHEVWFVGGCIRDALMERPVSDIDIASSASWQDVARICEARGMSAHETGTRHGTVTIVAEGIPFEVTTFRADSPTSKDARHPDSVEFVSTIEEDLLRRDFTVNAMAWHPKHGLIDPFGGRDDIAKGIIRAVGNPRKRFQEDALRILRGCRFASELGFRIDNETYQAMLSNKCLLSKVSIERTCHELDRFLLGEYVHDALMETVDIISFVLPELVAMKGFEQHTKYHIYDVLEHTAYAVQLAPRTRLLRWCALCHDMGKPASSFFDSEGVEHFYGHASVSAKLARGIAERLMMSNSFKTKLVSLIKAHSTKYEESSKAVRRAIMRDAAGDPELFRDLLQFKRADILAHAPEYHHEVAHIDQVEKVLDDVIASNEVFNIKALAINGHDMLQLGLQGPLIGTALRSALDAVIEGVVPNEKQSLLDYVTSLRQSNGATDAESASCTTSSRKEL